MFITWSYVQIYINMYNRWSGTVTRNTQTASFWPTKFWCDFFSNYRVHIYFIVLLFVSSRVVILVFLFLTGWEVQLATTWLIPCRILEEMKEILLSSTCFFEEMKMKSYKSFYFFINLRVSRRTKFCCVWRWHDRNNVWCPFELTHVI